ncbi:MAG: hypothetical protein QME66_01170 [Candidatus Eisenbacteria bacterium]|nr:hypothetical protein [Candidatus Eisenbacteria bacterium]
MKETLDLIVLIGRPAAGKSEVIDYLKSVDVQTRKKRFHIGEFEEIDDFPYLWEKFEEDDIFEKHGKERLHTTSDYYFKEHFFWNFMIEKINLAYRKRIARNPNYHDSVTAIVEFARGGENGIREAFSFLADEILRKGGIVYISVSYEESCRKNRRRFRPELKDSILYHSLPDAKMEFYYKTNDWDKIGTGTDGYTKLKGITVPYAVFQNEPEVTDKPEELGLALERVFGRLWKRMQERPREERR